MDPLHFGDLRAQRLDQGFGERDGAGVAVFRVVQHQLPGEEVDILNAQLQAVDLDAQAAAVHESIGEPVDPLGAGEDRRDLFTAEDGGEVSAAPGPQRVDLTDLDAEHPAVKEEEGVESDVLSARADVLVDGQVGEILPDRLRPLLVRVPVLLVENEVDDVGAVRLARGWAEVAQGEFLFHGLQQGRDLVAFEDFLVRGREGRYAGYRVGFHCFLLFRFPELYRRMRRGRAV